MTLSCLSLLAISTVSLEEITISWIQVSYLVLLLTKLEGLATLQRDHSLAFALGAFNLENNLLRGLCLLSEHRLCLPTETLLLGIVSSLTLSNQGSLTGLVLSHLMTRMLLAPLAEGIT